MLRWLPLVCACCSLSGAAPAPPPVLLGRVVNENSSPVSGAQVRIGKEGQTSPARLVADHAGVFRFQASSPGEYLVSVDREGFFQLKDRTISLSSGENEAVFVLNTLREIFESIDVTASPPGVDPGETAPVETLTGNQILFIPYASTNNLRNALTLLPGVVQDSRGGIHVDGSSEEQVLYTLDGFNVGDPLTGRLETRLSVESVSEVEVNRARFPAEVGKGAAGAVAVKTVTGDDKLRYSATNFVPGVESHKGFLIGNWTPRLNLSGPLSKGRAWFSDSIDARYDQQVIEELPPGEDRTSSWRSSNVARAQVNITPSNIAFAGFLVNYWNAPRTGLTVMDPIETTVDRRSRQYFAHWKDQQYFQRGAVVEAGVAVNRTFAREIPQGPGFLILTPDGKLGNYFVDAVRKGSRDQFIANVFFPAFVWHGRHQVKSGTDIDRVGYWQDARRSGYRQENALGTQLSEVTFGGTGRFGRSNFEAAAYFQDSWQVHRSLLLELGIRTDYDRIIHNSTASPRFGLAWAPARWPNTKVSGGFGVVYDASHLRLFTRPFDQYALMRLYAPGGAMIRGPALSVYEIRGSHFDAPEFHNFSLGVERAIVRGVYLRVNYFRKRGIHGFTYRNSVDPATPPSPSDYIHTRAQYVDAVYRLGNDRRDVFDSVEATVRHSFGAEYEWAASYSRSRAFSNAVVDITVDDPIIVSDNVGRMPWDAPNRALSWGVLPSPFKNYSLAYAAEWRTGYPFTVFDDFRQEGALNSHRYPDYFAANLHIERRFVFRGHRWALRAGANNITSHYNPTGVNNNMTSAHFMTYYGATGRTFNFRLRWLGKAQ